MKTRRAMRIERSRSGAQAAFRQVALVRLEPWVSERWRRELRR